MLHRLTPGLVELAAGTRRDGRLLIKTRRRADHFLPGGAAGKEGWLGALLELAARHADRGEEVFLAPAARVNARGDKHAVSETRFLWVDIDHPGQLHALWAFLAERPCHLLIASGGSGGAHAYWKLDQPLPGNAPRRADRRSDRADRALKPAARPRTGSGRRRQAQRRRPGVRGALARDAPRRHGQRQDRPARPHHGSRLPPSRLLHRAARGRPPRPGRAGRPEGRTRGAEPRSVQADQPAGVLREARRDRRPARRARLMPGALARGRHPSCSVGTSPEQGWCCHAGSCGARGAIYDLASVLLGGPWGHELRGEAFKRARAYVADVFGELHDQTQPAKEER